VRWRRRLLFGALAGLVATGALFDGAMRYHSQALAAEWWHCLVARTPPALRHELPSPVSAGLDVGELVAASAAAGVTENQGLDAITVAVVDSGMDAGHDELRERVLRGLDTVNPCGDGRSDPSGHGTAVAGIISSAAPTVRILPVRTSLSTGAQLRWANAAAIVWATNRDADVINLSNSSRSSSPSRIEHAAVRYATQRGVVLVAAAGNNPARRVAFPAAYPEVIGVTAVDRHRRLAVFASRRGKVDLAAPGTGIETFAPGGTRRVVSGTSFATPYVSAVVARLLAANPELTPDEVKQLLIDTAVGLPPEATAHADRPFGVVDLDAALQAAGVTVTDSDPRPVLAASSY
jgi:subtilisin family serine protease